MNENTDAAFEAEHVETIDANADVVNVYPAADGWRWRRVAANGRIVSDGGEGYTRKADAVKAAERTNEGVQVNVADLPAGDFEGKGSSD